MTIREENAFKSKGRHVLSEGKESDRFLLLTDFLEKLPSLSTTEEFNAAFESLMEAYGFRYFVIIVHPAFSRDFIGRILVGHWPEGWTERYLERKYVLIDPIVRHMGHAQTGFNWKDAVMSSHSNADYKRIQRMMLDALKHGLESGYAFPIHSRQGIVGNMSLSGRVELSELEISLFDCIARYSFWHVQNISNPEKPDDDEEYPSTDLEPNLTPREAQILSFLADGLTSGEIADHLELSPHTVDWHIGSLESKLQAKNRHHAVATAFRHGLVS